MKFGVFLYWVIPDCRGRVQTSHLFGQKRSGWACDWSLMVPGVSYLSRLSAAAGYTGVAGGSFVVLGWVLRPPRPFALKPVVGTMTPLTPFCFFLTPAALLLA